jgi:hypothetical protein
MSLISKILFLTVLLVAPSAGQGRVEGRGDARRFISEKYEFSLAVPVGWGVSAGLDTPVFFYSPSSERFGQSSIPEGGAVITVESHDAVSGRARSATTPDAWARADTRAVASSVPSIESFEFPTESGASHAVMCSYDEAAFTPDQRTVRSVAIFWEFRNKLFAAHLNYNAGDSNAPALQRVFLQAVRSTRPLDRR